MLNIIIGNSANDRESHFYELLQDSKTENNLTLVSHQAVTRYEAYLAKNNISGFVASIDDTYNSLVVALGLNLVNVASNVDKIAVVSDIISDGFGKQIMTSEYSASGLVNKVQNAITDLKKSGIPADQFSKWAINSCYSGLFYKKITDVAAIYREFEKRLKAAGLTTKEDVVNCVLDKIERDTRIIYDNVFISELSEYTPSTIRLICGLLNVSRNMTISFDRLSKKIHGYIDCSDTDRTIIALKKACEGKIEINEICCNSSDSNTRPHGIEIIRENFFDRRFKTEDTAEDVTLIEAATPGKEIDIVCSEIVKLCESGCSPDAISVASTVIEDYFPLIQKSFSSHGIKFRYFKDSSLSNTQLFKFVDLLFANVIAKKKSISAIVQLSQISYMGLTEDEISLISAFYNRFGDDYDDAIANCKKFNADEYDKIVHIIDKVMFYVDFFDTLISESLTVDQYISTILQMVLMAGIRENFDKEIQELQRSGDYQGQQNLISIWNSFAETLNSMHDVFLGKELNLENFTRLFSKICDEKKIVDNNRCYGEVNVCSLSEIPYSKCDSLFIVGCTEGTLINTPDQSLFTEDEKVVVNSALTANIHSNDYYINKKIYNLYTAMTTPDSHLFITWPLMNNSYSPVSRASIINNICRIFKNQIISESDYIRSNGEADFKSLLCELSSIYYRDEKVPEHVQDRVDKYSKNALFGDRLARFINNLAVNKNELHFRRDFSGRYIDKLSVTKAEKYNECPFKYFVSAYLHPSEKKLFEETTADVGTFYHEVFSRFYLKVKHDKISYKQLLANKLMFDYLVCSIEEEVIKEHNEGYLKGDAKNRYMAKTMCDTVNISIWNSLKQVVAGEFEPTLFECDVSELSQANVTLSDGSIVRMSGIVDRIDVLNKDGQSYARIIDYKSGNVSFNRKKLELGVQLQLPLYAKALQDYVAAGMYYFHVHNPFTKTDVLEPKTESNFRLSGPTLLDNSIPESSDTLLSAIGCSVASDVINVRKTTKGDYYATSDVVNSDDMMSMINTAAEKYKSAAENIRLGNTVATPISTKDMNSCTYCQYNAMCANKKRKVIF